MAAIFVPDRQLHRYLLGRLSGRERSEVEYTARHDGFLRTRIEAVEFALIEDYVSSRLFGQDLADFERRYSATPEGLQRIEAVRALVQRPAAQAGAADTAVSEAPGDTSDDARERSWWEKLVARLR